MNTGMIVQAWKDPAYRASLGIQVRATDPQICCFLTYVNCPTFEVVCQDLES